MLDFHFGRPGSAPLYSSRPSAWAGCVRGPFVRLPPPSAGFTWRSHVPEATWFWGLSRTPLPCCARSSPPVLHSARRTSSACRHRQGPDPLQHRPDQAPRQVTLRQEQPVVARVFHEPRGRLDEALLETGQRPRVDPMREHEPPQKMPKVVDEPAQRPPDLVRSEPVTGQSCPGRRLLAFLVLSS